MKKIERIALWVLIGVLFFIFFIQSHTIDIIIDTLARLATATKDLGESQLGFNNAVTKWIGKATEKIQ